MSRLADTLPALRDRGRAAFVAYLTAGDPDLPTSERIARAIVDAGVDVLELGLPFTDPIADGPVLQHAADRALRAGTRPDDLLALAARLRDMPVPLVLFTYWNPLRALIARRGWDAIQSVDAVLVVDLPPEEAAPLWEGARPRDIDTVMLVAPTTPDARIASQAAASRGFLYCVSSKGVTGARDVLPAELPELVARARAHAGALPVIVGFGIATRDVAGAVAKHADGFVVGSGLMQEIAAATACGRDPAEAAAAFVRAVDPRPRDVAR
jgi:tryptophan synthase alpha chain